MFMSTYDCESFHRWHRMDCIHFLVGRSTKTSYHEISFIDANRSLPIILSTYDRVCMNIFAVLSNQTYFRFEFLPRFRSTIYCFRSSQIHHFWTSSLLRSSWCLQHEPALHFFKTEGISEFLGLTCEIYTYMAYGGSFLFVYMVLSRRSTLWSSFETGGTAFVYSLLN